MISIYQEFMADGGSRLSAALAYYSLFATAPLIVMATFFAGVFVGEALADDVVFGALEQLLGSELATFIYTLVDQSQGSGSYAVAWVAGLALLWSVGLALHHLQSSFNRMWHVTLRPGAPRGDIVRSRLLSAGIVLLPAAILVVSSLLSTVLVTVLGRIDILGLDELLSRLDLQIVLGASAVAAFLTLYKFLPDVRVPWRPAIISSLAAAVAWLVGTYLFGLYVDRTAASNVYGAAATAFVLLVWLNYSARVALVGCKLTKVLTERDGGSVTPAPYAEAYERVLLDRDDLA